jgi:hypothetical protein
MQKMIIAVTGIIHNLSERIKCIEPKQTGHGAKNVAYGLPEWALEGRPKTQPNDNSVSENRRGMTQIDNQWKACSASPSAAMD